MTDIANFEKVVSGWFVYDCACLMKNLRVSCEFAGSGQHIQTFDFDFIHKNCYELRRLINRHDASALLCNMRLFLGHGGRELTTDAGVFGSQRTLVINESHSAWTELPRKQWKKQQTSPQEAQKQAHVSDDLHHDVVISVAAYDDVHVVLN